MGESSPLVRLGRSKSSNRFSSKPEVVMPLGDGGSYFFLSNIIAGARALGAGLAAGARVARAP